MACCDRPRDWKSWNNGARRAEFQHGIADLFVFVSLREDSFALLVVFDVSKSREDFGRRKPRTIRVEFIPAGEQLTQGDGLAVRLFDQLGSSRSRIGLTAPHDRLSHKIRPAFKRPPRRKLLARASRLAVRRENRQHIGQQLRTMLANEGFQVRVFEPVALFGILQSRVQANVSHAAGRVRVAHHVVAGGGPCDQQRQFDNLARSQDAIFPHGCRQRRVQRRAAQAADDVVDQNQRIARECQSRNSLPRFVVIVWVRHAGHLAPGDNQRNNIAQQRFATPSDIRIDQKQRSRASECEPSRRCEQKREPSCAMIRF